MPKEVRVEQASPRVLAAAQAVVTPDRIGAELMRLLDQVWQVLREQGAPTGHNVVVYRPGEGGTITMEAGVEVPDGFAERDPVRQVTTPAGEVATAAHYGEYSRMGDAYTAIEQWCAANDRQQAGVNWEVYGDWDADSARLRTDVYALLLPVVPAP